MLDIEITRKLQYDYRNMNDAQFESLYPPNSYEKQIEKIFILIKEGKSMQLLGLPGTGRSIVLRLLSYNRNVRIKHIGENQKLYHFVSCDFSEVKDENLFGILKYLFLSLADSLRDRGLMKEHDRIHQVFKEHLQYQDELILFQGLKEAIYYLTAENNLTVVFLCDRFETYVPAATQKFFSNLYILRNQAKYHFSVIFSLNRLLEEYLDSSLFSDFYEYFEDATIYVPIIDRPTLDFHIERLEKISGKKIQKDVFNTLLKITGGHGNLTRLSVEFILSHTEMNTADISYNQLATFLLSQKAVIKNLQDIWNILTKDEKNVLLSPEGKTPSTYLKDINLLHNGIITIPLLSLAAIQKHFTSLRKESLVFNEKTNDILKGNTSIGSVLTSAEFKLLTFFLRNQNRIVNREEVIQVVWESNQTTAGVTDQALDQLIFRLRKKIEPDVNNPAYLQTIKGRGFKLVA